MRLISKSMFVLTSIAALAAVHSAAADTVQVVSGQTSVLLDTATLSAAASLDLSGVAGGTIAPGDLGAASVAFPINPPGASPPDLPTTFSYDPADFLGTFAGTIEHNGSVLFNSDTIEVGNFTIGFDAGRIVGSASGFFVESTTGLNQILFDLANPVPVATSANLMIDADLIVSPEFAQDLLDLDLADDNLTGADVGDARVMAIIPEPSAAGLALIGLATLSGAFAWRRRAR